MHSVSSRVRMGSAMLRRSRIRTGRAGVRLGTHVVRMRWRMTTHRGWLLMRRMIVLWHGHRTSGSWLMIVW